jgi:ADP-heptose:LPS heptosyltransferase/GT2 family glycosyltransferase
VISLFDSYDVLAKSGLFDPDFYRANNPDVAALNVDPLVHYLEQGAREGRTPNGAFDTAFYLEQCRVRGEAPENPLLHFLTVGRARGLKTRRDEVVAESEDGVILTVDLFGFERNGAGLRLVLEGWALAPHPINEIALEIDGKVVGYAAHGLRRLDVARIYPGRERVDHAGFALMVDGLPESFGAAREAAILLRLADGTLRRQTVTPATLGQAGAGHKPGPVLRPELPALQLNVEQVEITDRGILEISGWAVGLAGVASVEVFVEEERIGAAELGRTREDVAQALRAYPDARSSGFALSADLGRFGPGRRTVKVQALTKDGVSRESFHPVTLQAVAPVRAPEEAFHYAYDELLLTVEGQLLVTGWAICGASIESIAVFVDDLEAGQAKIGLERPDVANVHPTLQHARNSGFTFGAQLGQSFRGGHAVNLKVRSVAGELREISTPVAALDRPDAPPAAPIAPTAPSATPEGDADLKLYLDSPRLTEGMAAMPVRNSLAVSGWALSRNGVASVDIDIDNLHVAQAYYGVRRQDVANAFPDWGGALRSGFAALIPHTKLPQGRHAVRIVLRDRAGKTAVIAFAIEVEELSDSEQPSEQGRPWSIRRKMPQAEIDLQSGILAAVDWRPRFALLLLLDGGDDAVSRARATLASLRDQAYGDWRVFVAARGEGDRAQLRMQVLVGVAEIADKLEVLAEGDERRLADIAATAERAGRPVFLALLGAGDELSCDALLETAVSSALHREADFLYSDERRRSPTTDAADVFLKPQWSPDLLLSTHYIGRLWCARRELLARTGATVAELLRHGDYDLVLRCTEAATSIRHIPALLCQRGGVPLDSAETERLALERALERRGIAGKIEAGQVPGVYRLHRAAVARGLVSIIIPTCAARGLIKVCIESLRKTTRYRSYEIICIENIPEAERGWKDWLRANADEVIECAEPFNWARYNNLAVARAAGEFLLFLNDDIEIIDPDWLDAMLEHARRPEVGVVGPQLLFPDHTVQHAGVFLAAMGRTRHAFRHAREDDPGYFGLALTQRNVIGVTGACLLTRRETFEALGRFEEAHSVINNDLDFCLKAWRRGLLNVFTPYAKLIHHELASRGEIDDQYDEALFEKEWHDLFMDGDPYFHPRLSRDSDEYVPEREAARLICSGHPLLDKNAVHDILVLKLDHIGDCVLAFPALRRLKQHFPNAKIHVLSSPATASVWKLEPAVDRIVEFEFFHARSELGKKELGEETLRELRGRLGETRFDLAIDLRKHLDTRHLLQHTGARFLAGYDHQGGYPWLDIALEWESDPMYAHKRQHIVEDLMNLVEMVAANCEPDRTLITAPPAPDGQLRRRKLTGRVVCIHPGAGNRTKQWPVEYFSALIDRLVEGEGAKIALVGGPDEKEIAAKVVAKLRHPKAVVNLVGKLTLAELPGFIAGCTLFVGNDSGPKHIAAGLGIPTIGVHSGVVDPREWGPVGPRAVAIGRDMLCSPCYLENAEDCPRGLACLTGLGPGEVYKLSQRLLAMAPRASRAAGGDQPAG